MGRTKGKFIKIEKMPTAEKSGGAIRATVTLKNGTRLELENITADELKKLL